VEKMMKSGVLKSISVTNSHPTAIHLADIKTARRDLKILEMVESGALEAIAGAENTTAQLESEIKGSIVDLKKQLDEKEFIKVYDISQLMFDFLINDRG
jgi:hypothetical protein